MNTAPEQLYNCDVMGNDGTKIGTVDNVWVDDASNQLEFIGVKTGWLFGKIHVIPMTDAEFGEGAITVPYGQDQVKNAPSYGQNDELSPSSENEIYSYYGLGRETEDTPTGMGDDSALGSDGRTGWKADQASRGTDFAKRDYGASDTNEVTLSEEKLDVGKREVEAGRVRLRKVVRTEHQEVPVELQRELVSIERIDASESNVPTNAFQEQEIEVPVMREEAVVGKESRVTGGARLSKSTEVETRNVGGDVRSEDVELDRDGETESNNAAGNRDYTRTNSGL